MSGAVAGLWHFPVKGLTGQPLDRVALRPGAGFPLDRVFALARHGGAFDPAAPAPVAKTHFHMLARDAGLARQRSHYDAASGVLTVERPDGEGLAADLSTAAGEAAARAFFGAVLGLVPAAWPALARGGAHRFTDVAVVSEAMMNAVSLINADSVRAFAGRIGVPLDPLRFRANLVFEGVPAMRERDWIGRRVHIGTAVLEVCRLTRRCAATTVNLATGERDVPVPRLLAEIYGQPEMGVYAHVVGAGVVRPGDPVRPE